MAKAFIFDMDGLLIDSEPIWRGTEASVFVNLGMPVKPDDMYKTTGMFVSEVVDYWCEQFPSIKVDKQQTAQAIIDGVVAGIKAGAKMLPGAKNALQVCISTGLPVALATSSRHSIIQAVLDKFDLADNFKVIKSAQDEPYGKPNPAIFIATAKQLSIEPEDCLVFEDSLNGVIAAKAAKMKCIAVPAPENYDDQRFSLADIKLKSLQDFTADTLRNL